MKIKTLLFSLAFSLSAITQAELVGYSFSGDLTPLESGTEFDQFAGGSYFGTIVYDTEAPFIQEDDVHSIAQGAELSVTFLNNMDEEYYYSVSNAVYGVLLNFGGNPEASIDAFVNSTFPNSTGAYEPFQISTNLPFPVGQSAGIARFLLLGDELFSSTSLGQELDLSKSFFSFLDIATDTGELDEFGNPVLEYRLRGEITLLEPIDVEQPTPVFSLTKSINIGYFSETGVFSHNEGLNQYDITTGGYSIGNWEDWLYFVYEEVQGDFDMRARVPYISQSWGSAGIMIRDKLTTASKMASSILQRDNGARFITRKEEWTPVPPVEAPSVVEGGWLRLVKEGNTVSNYISEDGESWTLVATETIEFSETVYVGIASARPCRERVDIIVEDFSVEFH